MFALERVIAMEHITHQLRSNLRSDTKQKTAQMAGVTYKLHQKILESIYPICDISSSDSKIHSFVPSSFTLFHHRSPTSSLPDTFFT